MRVAVVFDTSVPGWTPEDYRARMLIETAPGYAGEAESAYQVAHALESRGHQVLMVGGHTSPDEVTEPLRRWNPDVAFNLAEGFGSHDQFDYILPAALEMEGHAYTGAGPQALMITRNKAMSKKILAHHGVQVPRFLVIRLGEGLPKKSELFFPAIVKPLQLDASQGISQASVVHDAAQLKERVAFIHERLRDAAIIEQFIPGRELYVTVLGNGRQARCLPTIELVFSDKLKPEQRIVTTKAKWDNDYCEERGIVLQFARKLSRQAEAEIERTCLVAYRALWLRDYGRFDIRLDDQDRVWVLEGNANPYLGRGHEAAEAARKAGMGFEDLVERIVKIAHRRHRRERRHGPRRRRR